ncbi:peptidase T [Testudinibacter aquarius]|uniref:Peptidase T n=1 Tax=Testudinibacter aquarius TaxID=1524974 RepID=A0A4R3YA62_9PAST|nr:peptidase T [Testudinibacter aquarius]KAE9528993.1 peptidase T [Testudinibacter aquarius]TCV89275.1 tripeptide aminopeptidase [Testudinibacter aquarius]TNG93329.1 peptidase T [Testudinibacter aquarius]
MQQQLIERFFRYLAISSQSNAAASSVPSSDGQWKMAELLSEELKQLGLSQIHIDQYANVTALLPGSVPNATPIGFVAHMDTVDVALSAQISPQIKRFDGTDLVLNPAQNIKLKVAEHPEILAYQGQEIIFSDGTSVLGADNKAAIANIMTALSIIQQQKIPTGDIYIAFVPDEEIGLRGAKQLDLTRFKPDFAYTIDCCELGEVVYENFNAAAADITIYGISAHPMSAKGVMVNPILVAHDLISRFDRNQTPECTEQKEGYWWFNRVDANQSQAKLQIAIRDFDKTAFEQRKDFILQSVTQLQQQYPQIRVECKIEDIYGNIANTLTDDRRSIDLLFSAMQQLDITAKVTPMRGGTDGAALSVKGITTPNYFTGAHNFHSKFEFLPIPSFVKSCELTLQLIKQATKSSKCG